MSFDERTMEEALELKKKSKEKAYDIAAKVAKIIAKDLSVLTPEMRMGTGLAFYEHMSYVMGDMWVEMMLEIGKQTDERYAGTKEEKFYSDLTKSAYAAETSNFMKRMSEICKKGME